MPVDLNFTSAATSARPDLADAFESEIGARLPADYRKFLLTRIGGAPAAKDPETSVFAWVPVDWKGKDTESEVLLKYLFVLEDWTGIHEERRLEILTLSGYQKFLVTEKPFPVPKGLIAIGINPGGNAFFLDVAGSRIGSVWFRSPHLYAADQAEAEPMHNFGFVASSFAAMIESIRLEEY